MIAVNNKVAVLLVDDEDDNLLAFKATFENL